MLRQAKLTGLTLGLLFWSITHLCAQQKPEFLLVGVFHEMPDSLGCNWTSVYQKILDYQPDQIAVEYVMPSDSVSQIQDWGKNYRKDWADLMLAWEGKKVNVADSIQSLQQRLTQKDDPALRLRLWRYYHLHPDIGNRDYQSYLIQQNADAYRPLLDTTRQWDHAFLKRHHQVVNGRKNGEYFNLVFPVAKARGITYLYPTDEKKTYPVQSEAYGKFTEALENTADIKNYEAFWKDFIATEAREKANCNGMLFINSKKWLKKSDYGQAKILEETKNADYAQYAKVWYERNESIANNIIQAAKASQARKMAVFYGYMHIAPVKKFLEKQGYKVRLIGNLK